MGELNAVKADMEIPIPKAAIQSAYIHKKMVKEMVTWDYENVKILDLVKRIEDRIVSEVGSVFPGQTTCDCFACARGAASACDLAPRLTQLNGGIAFPVGIGINHCVAHYTPLAGNQTTIRRGDLVKIDFGVHIDGEITDSAFTIGVKTTDFDPLIEISRKATMIGVKASGPDKLLSEIGAEIEEYVTSKEILLPCSSSSNSTPVPLKVMRELCGHSIAPYTIHAGKAVPNCKIDFEYPLRMRPGEKYAIEPFVTTGNGVNIYGPEKSHYMLKPLKSQPKSHYLSQFHKSIMEKYGTLPFNRRWLDDDFLLMSQQTSDPLWGSKRVDDSLLLCARQSRANRVETETHLHLASALDQMVKEGILEEYPPIYDVEGSYVAQTEHNVWIGEKRAYQLT